MLLVIIILAAALWIAITPAQAQDDQKPEYIGSRLCFGCHRDVGPIHYESRHALTLSEPSQAGAVLGDFNQESEVLVLQLPGENEPRALTIDDIAYTLGTGRYVQRYLIAVEGEAAGDDEEAAEPATTQYLVLPVEWNVIAGRWQPYTLAEDWPAPEYDWEDQCAACHVTGFSVDTGTWLENGVQCETCHGPGSAHLEAVRSRTATPAEQRASIVLSPDAAICGQCHSAGTAPDGHPYPTDYLAGDALLDSGYALVAPDDATHWWASGHASHPNMQFNEWLNSTHASALEGLRSSERAQDACLACHSADYAWSQVPAEAADEAEGEGAQPVTVASAVHGVTCVSCHVIHQAPGEDDAAPVDFLLAGEPYALCVSCHQDTDVTGVIHAPVKEMYEGESIIEGIDGVPSAHFVAAGGPTCVTCHMPRVPVETATRGSHAFHPVMPGVAANIAALQDSCSICHADKVDAPSLQVLINDIQADTRARLEAARAALTEETPAWVEAALRFVEGDGSLGVHNYVYTDIVLDRVERELGLNNDAAAGAATGQ